MALKVYVRDAKDAPIILEIIRAEWGALKQLVVLQADICRTDLLVEIEAVCWSSVN
jgi:chorismate lyase/3-hydroxybenzoate synthase